MTMMWVLALRARSARRAQLIARSPRVPYFAGGTALLSGIPFLSTPDSSKGKTTSKAEGAPTEEDEGHISNEADKAKDASISSYLPWHGLSFLRPSFSIPTPDLSSIVSLSWPTALSSIQQKFSALMLELSRGEGSLYSEIVSAPPDTTAHPELEWDARVRVGDDLSLSERAFLRQRRRVMKGAFAKLFGVPEEEIDERDLPVVAFAGSGGGFRAMINTIGSLAGAQKSGLLDCMTYTAGISGSCWALGVLYSGVAGASTPAAAASHLKSRIATSYLDMSTLDMLITNPTNKFLLSGLLRKAASPTSSLALTDIYGTLLSARLFVPNQISDLDHRVLKTSHIRRLLENASMPMPIFTAIRHEIPTQKEERLKEVRKKEVLAVEPSRRSLSEKEEARIEEAARWLWFEFTPYEVGCDELGAWIPTWALGRRFDKGRSIERTPELSMSILTGIYGSAFCATLQMYFKEIQPVLRQLPLQLYNWMEEIVTENDKDLEVIHPVVPNEIPNFVKGMGGQLRMGSPPDIAERDTLGFMDAGAVLNIPYYPLFRRNVDCIIAADASADSQDLWFTRAEEYARRRGLDGWPRGARWPTKISDPESDDSNASSKGPSNTHRDSNVDEEANVAANRKLAEAQETEASEQANKTEHAEEQAMESSISTTASSSDSGARASSRLSASTIWIGSSSSHTDTSPSSSSELESARMEELEEQELFRRDGISIVYNPLIPNDNAVPGFDPFSVSTWSVQVPEEETEKLLKVAEANFVEGHDKVVKLLKAIWRRKKNEREKREQAGEETSTDRPKRLK